MTDFPDLKFKALVNFPARVVGGAGIDVAKQNGSYQLDLDFGDFAPPVGGVADPTHSNALLWNSVTGAYSLVPVSVIATGGGVPEAPNDGVQYGRQALNWTPITGGGSVVTPAPLTRVNDANVTLTLGGTPATALLQATSITVGWSGTLAASRGGFGADVSAQNGVPLFTSGVAAFTPTTGSGNVVLSNGPALTGIPTAPTAAPGTGTTQIATTAFVAAAVSGGGSFVDAPSDGFSYGRLNLAWAKVAPLNSPALTGVPTAPTAALATNTTQIATTAFVLANGSSVPPATATPLMDGTAAVGVATKYAREDHVHPTDTSRAPLASPTFTGDPKAPTPTAGDNDTSIATTAFVTAAVAAGGGGGGFPSGTVMLFYQATAPTGWTQLTTQNDKALRVVSGSGGVSGGTNAFSTVMAQTVVGNTTITTGTMPPHSHGIGAVIDFNVGSSYNANAGASGSVRSATNTDGGSGGAHNHPITMAIQYIDVILASKN